MNLNHQATGNSFVGPAFTPKGSPPKKAGGATKVQSVSDQAWAILQARRGQAGAAAPAGGTGETMAEKVAAIMYANRGKPLPAKEG